MQDERLLQKVVSDFYDLMFADVMIGYMFEGKNKQRLIQKELELALEILGEKGKYTGRNLKNLHQPLKIQGGQFDRRLVLLRKAIEKNHLPEEIKQKWLEHTESLRHEVTWNLKGQCVVDVKK